MKYLNLKKILFSIIVSICFSLISNAQVTSIGGYFVSNSNDTLFGKLEYSKAMFSQKQIFSYNNSSKIVFLKPDSVKEYYFPPNILYKTKNYKGEKKFLQVISEGKINLYTDGWDLFVTNKSDSLLLLKGGKEIVKIDGKSYSKSVETYKYQIKYCISDSAYFKEIDDLYFDKKPIIKLVKSINEEKQGLNEKKEFAKIYHKNYFNIGFNLSINRITFTGYEYSNDSLFENYNENMTIKADEAYKEPQNMTGIGIGVEYKRKINKSNTYLAFALNYNKLLNTQTERIGLLHSNISYSGFEEPKYSDTIGSITDLYNLNLNYFTFPITIHQEIKHNKLRPFADFGFVNRFILNSGTNIERTVIIDDQTTYDTIELDIPTYSMGIKFGLGARYLFNFKNSVSFGISIDLSINNNNSNLKKFNATNFYVSYNF